MINPQDISRQSFIHIIRAKFALSLALAGSLSGLLVFLGGKVWVFLLFASAVSFPLNLLQMVAITLRGGEYRDYPLGTVPFIQTVSLVGGGILWALDLWPFTLSLI